jgi:hypothetical protein
VRSPPLPLLLLWRLLLQALPLAQHTAGSCWPGLSRSERRLAALPSCGHRAMRREARPGSGRRSGCDPLLPSQPSQLASTCRRIARPLSSALADPLCRPPPRSFASTAGQFVLLASLRAQVVSNLAAAGVPSSPSPNAPAISSGAGSKADAAETADEFAGLSSQRCGPVLVCRRQPSLARRPLPR